MLPLDDKTGRLVRSKLRFSINYIPKVKSDIKKIRQHVINTFPQDELFILENRVKIKVNVFIKHKKKINYIFNDLLNLITDKLILETFDGLILSNKSHIVSNKLCWLTTKKDEKVIFEFIN